MLNLNNDFHKLFIDTSYIYDVSFGLKDETYVKKKGGYYLLNNIIATKCKENDDVSILFNIEYIGTFREGEQYTQFPIEIFEDCEEMKKQIIEHLNKHINDVIYSDNDKSI